MLIQVIDGFLNKKKGNQNFLFVITNSNLRTKHFSKKILKCKVIIILKNYKYIFVCVNFVVKLLNQLINFYLGKKSSYKTLSCTHLKINTKKL